MQKTAAAILFSTLFAGASHAQGATEPAPPPPPVADPVETESAPPAPPPAPAPAIAPAAEAPTPPPASATTPAPPEAASEDAPDVAVASEKPLLDRVIIRGTHGALAGAAAATTMLGALGTGYVFYQLALTDLTVIGQASPIDDALFGILAAGTWLLSPVVAVVVAATTVGLFGGSAPFWRVMMDGFISTGLGALITGIPGALLGAIAGFAFGAFASYGIEPLATGLAVGAVGAVLGGLVIAPLGAAAGAVGGSVIGGLVGADPSTFEWE